MPQTTITADLHNSRGGVRRLLITEYDRHTNETLAVLYDGRLANPRQSAVDAVFSGLGLSQARNWAHLSGAGVLRTRLVRK